MLLELLGDGLVLPFLLRRVVQLSLLAIVILLLLLLLLIQPLYQLLLAMVHMMQVLVHLLVSVHQFLNRSDSIVVS